MIELTSGITCANLATLRPLLRNVFPTLFGSSSTPSAEPPSYVISPNAPSKSLSAGGGWASLGNSSSSNKAEMGSAVDDVEMQSESWELKGRTSRDSIFVGVAHTAKKALQLR